MPSVVTITTAPAPVSAAAVTTATGTLSLASIWSQLVEDIQHKQAWKVSAFDGPDFMGRFADDLTMYTTEEERARISERRSKALELCADPAKWSQTCLDAMKELSENTPGSAVELLTNFGVLESFVNFTEHMHYFDVTRKLMQDAGESVVVLANLDTRTHDIDKLDPIMLAGFSERWTDNKTTGLWDACIVSHYKINVHHQQNPLWNTDQDEDIYKALSELYCDKCSRCLQKALKGQPDLAMWEVPDRFYMDMPKLWLERTRELAARIESFYRKKTVKTE